MTNDFKSQRNLVKSINVQDCARLFDNLTIDDPLLTAEEVAKLLKVSAKTIYLWAKQHRLRSVNLGRAVRFRQEDLSEFLERHRTF